MIPGRDLTVDPGRWLQRRLSIVSALGGLAAFAGGIEPLPVSLPFGGLLLLGAMLVRPGTRIDDWIERTAPLLALLLATRAASTLLRPGGDVVPPAVELLLVLLVAEALKVPGVRSAARLQALSFALVLAGTAYRPGILFGIGMGVWLAAGLAALRVGHAADRGGREARPAAGPAPPRLLLRGAAGMALLSFGIGLIVFAALPRLPSQAGTGRGSSSGTVLAGFSERVSLGEHGTSIQPNPELLLRIEFPEAAPQDPSGIYLRGVSFDRFDGLEWSRSRRVPPSADFPEWYRTRWEGPGVRQAVFPEALGSRVLFGIHPVLEVRTGGGSEALRSLSGDLYWGGSGGTPPPYEVISIGGTAPAGVRGVITRGEELPGRLQYLQIPGRLRERITPFADSLLGASAPPLQEVETLLRWFREEFSYTLELPATASEASVQGFLFDRKAGHCEYFATGLTLLLRSRGIPARPVNGFLGGSWNPWGSYLAVTGNQAHSWVEVWFDGYGWVTFDPTPPGQGAGGALGGASGLWQWPGSARLAAIQHRWSKWILNYAPDRQSQVLEGLRTALTGRWAARSVPGDASGPSSASGDEDIPLPAIAVLLLLLIAGIIGFRRRRAPGEVERWGNRLRSASSAIVPGAETMPPFRLISALVRAGAEPGGAAERGMREYARRRFGAPPGTGSAEGPFAPVARAALRELRLLSRRPGAGAQTGPDRPGSLDPISPPYYPNAADPRRGPPDGTGGIGRRTDSEWSGP